MFQLWKVGAAVGAFAYEAFQFNYLVTLHMFRGLKGLFMQDLVPWWGIGIVIMLIAFGWSQFQVRLIWRWLVVFIIYGIALVFIHGLHQPRTGLLIALYCEAFTAVAIASTILHLLPSSWRARFE